MAQKHILVAIDLSDITQAIMKKTTELAKLFNAKISMAHVIEPIPAYGYPGITDLESPMIDEAKEELDKIGKKFNIKPDNIFVEFGSVKNEILDIADEQKIDLIVLGSHGRHGLSRLIGSCASAIVHGANTDVYIVRNKDN